MCLAVPGKVTQWISREALFASALVDFGGVARQVSMACVPEAIEGQYVLVHAGIAISLIDQEAASRILKTLQAIDSQTLDELKE